MKVGASGRGGGGGPDYLISRGDTAIGKYPALQKTHMKVLLLRTRESKRKRANWEAGFETDLEGRGEEIGETPS